MRASAVGHGLRDALGLTVDIRPVLAAHLLKGRAKKVDFKDGRYFLRGKRSKSLTWKDLAIAAYEAKSLPKKFEPGLEASSFFEPPNCTFPFGTHIVAVEIDRDTG